MIIAGSCSVCSQSFLGADDQRCVSSIVSVTMGSHINPLHTHFHYTPGESHHWDVSISLDSVDAKSSIVIIMWPSWLVMTISVALLGLVKFCSWLLLVAETM